MAATYKVNGMTCQGCARAVTNAIRRVAPAAAVSVDVEGGRVRVDGPADDRTVQAAVTQAGFEFAGRA